MSQSKNRKLRRMVFANVRDLRERDPHLSLEQAVDVAMRGMLKAGVPWEKIETAFLGMKK